MTSHLFLQSLRLHVARLLSGTAWLLNFIEWGRYSFKSSTNDLKFQQKFFFDLNSSKQEIPEVTVHLSSYQNHHSDEWKWQNLQNWNSHPIFYRWKTELATCRLHQISLRRQLHLTKSCQRTHPTLLVNSSGSCSSHLLWNCLNIEISWEKLRFFRRVP